MHKRYALAVLAVCMSLIISCERAAQPAPKASQVAPQPLSAQPVSTSAESESLADSVETMPNDTLLVVTDTAGADFSGEDLSAVKSALETRLHADEFTASGPASPYGRPCRFYDTTSVRRYTGDDVRVSYAR